MLEKIIETTKFLKTKGFNNPDVGIILGTGLGELTSKIEKRIEIDIKISLIFQFRRSKDMQEN